MGVLMIGIVSFSVLIWVVATSLATESQAERRRATQKSQIAGDGTGIASIGKRPAAA